jgi:hypothetical protein
VFKKAEVPAAAFLNTVFPHSRSNNSSPLKSGGVSHAIETGVCLQPVQLSFSHPV